jgi:hypothetical protein
MMQTLAASRLVVKPRHLSILFAPARGITCHDVLQALRATHGQELATRDEPLNNKLYGEFNRIEDAERQAASAVTLLALASSRNTRRANDLAFKLENGLLKRGEEEATDKLLISNQQRRSALATGLRRIFRGHCLEGYLSERVWGYNFSQLPPSPRLYRLIKGLGASSKFSATSRAANVPLNLL